MIENKDQLIDIYDIWYEPFWQQGWFIILIMMTIGAMVCALLYFVYKKYIQKKVVVDCALIAYHDLDVLKHFHIVTEQDSKDCYFSLSSIVKKYLAGRYHTIFIQLTDKEIVRQVKPYMDEDAARLLQQILQGMTLVKFEHEIVATKKLEKDIALIQEFIENTTPQRDTKEI